MSLSDKAIKLRDKAEKESEKVLMAEFEEYDAGRNTRRERRQLLRIAHYYHLLQNMGIDDSGYRMEKYWELANKKIQQAREYDGKTREIAESRLIDEHIRAWNMAEYYYERGTKVLCQMMITLMDYILQEKTGASILYKGKDQSSYFDLLDEITGLNEEYISCYGFLCAYDFCTEKIADFMGIGEYRQLLKEHERIIANGMPKRVTETITQLQKAAGDGKAEYFTDICRAYTPEPPYSEDELERIYQKILKEGFEGNDVLAMTVFSTLVVKVDEYYEEFIKG